jgi:hypothetical protein
MFDFDRVIERGGTHASKWDNIARLSGIESPDAIPMWVADMDFSAPPGVTSALAAEIQRGVHGYYADTGSDSDPFIPQEEFKIIEKALDPDIIRIPHAKHFIEWVTFPQVLKYIRHTYPNAGAHLSTGT